MVFGELYGFDLTVHRELGWVAAEQSGKYDFITSIYAESKATGIKYTQNNGIPNTDNPKAAARYFLNAIDKVGSLVTRYREKLAGIENELPAIRELTQKRFDQEPQLAALKTELANLELEISRKIAEKTTAAGHE